MKILFINRGLGTLFGGGESFDYSAARYLQKLGHQIILLTAVPFFRRHKIQYHDVQIAVVAVPFMLRRTGYKLSSNYTQLSALFFKLDELLFGYVALRWLRKHRYEQFDIVQVLSLTWLTKHILQKFGIPCVSWLPGKPGRLQQKAIKAMMQYKHFALFTHGDTIRFVRKEMRITHVTEIPPGIELDCISRMQQDSHRIEFRNKMGLKVHDAIGITVARLIPVKNIPFLIEGVKHVVSKYPEYKHLIVGEGPLEEQLKVMVKHYGLQNSILFTGSVPHQDINSFLKSADLFVLTSVYESFSIALLEAMANSLPVVVTNTGYMSTMVKNAGSGIMVESSDVEHLYKAILYMLEHEQTRKEYGNNARKYAEQYDWNRVVEKLQSLYIDVIQ